MTEQYELGGREVASHSADLHYLKEAARIGNYKIEHRSGLVLVLEQASSTPWRAAYWYVSFNPADLYFPHDWFHEASSNLGQLFNRAMHGPQAIEHFARELRKGY